MVTFAIRHRPAWEDCCWGEGESFCGGKGGEAQGEAHIYSIDQSLRLVTVIVGFLLFSLNDFCHLHAVPSVASR